MDGPEKLPRRDPERLKDTEPARLVEWLRMEASMKYAHYESMLRSEDVDTQWQASGYLASCRWLDAAADRLAGLAGVTEPGAPADG